MRLVKGADPQTVKEAILRNRYICISEEDAERVAEWTNDTDGRNLLVIGKTGMGKSQLVQTLWPIFRKPANHFNGPWSKLRDVRADPMIIDGTNLGLGYLDRRWAKADAKRVEGLNECSGPLLVTSFSDLSGLRGEWLRVTLKWKSKIMEAEDAEQE